MADGMAVEQPFDAAAAGYDAGFSNTQLGRWLREAVWSHLGRAFGPGDHVLELGCGTGEDAVWLARRGVRVTATDASSAMLEVAQSKVAAAGVRDSVDFVQLDLAALSTDNRQPAIVDGPFDGVSSNFGPLNCLPDRRGVAAALAHSVRPGGQVVLVLMGPLCPWEIGWHLAHGQPGTAFRRFRAGVEAHAGGGATVRTWYPSPRRVKSEFRPDFVLRRLVGLAAFLPPPYLGPLMDRWPRTLRRLAAVDRRLGTVWPWTWLNDHYLVLLERR